MLRHMARKRDEEVRKIQLTGGSTFTLSLPKWWVEEMELEPGDGMVVREKGSSLVLSPDKLEKKKGPLEAEIEVESGASIDAINRRILSLYLIGCTSILIKAEGDRLRSSTRNAIKEFVRNKLVGTEIISESIESISLQTLLSYSELSVRGALRRMYDVVSSMQENCLTALNNFDKDLANDVIQIDDEVDRFQMYLIREIKAAIQRPSLLEEIGLDSMRECLGYRLVSKNIERVGDHCAKIAEYVIDGEEPLSEKSLKKILDFSDMAVSVFDNAVQSYFDGDYQDAETTIQDLSSVYMKEGEVNRYLADGDTSETLRGRLIMESLMRMAEYGSDIAEIVLNVTVSKGD